MLKWKRESCWGLSFFGADITDSSTIQQQQPSSFKIKSSVVQDIYKQIIIPLTKDVEVDYLMQRYNN